MIPRPYQTEALEALHSHICEKDTNPCIVIPTGGGKSALIAWVIQRWKESCPHFRCCILAHRKELIEQNATELEALCPEVGDVGVFSAALGLRDYDANILYASIDSVYKRSGEFPPWDVIMVDEAHRIPFKGEGKYRTFINESRKFNKDLRVIGWTATPFRMAGGQICHRDHILNEVCYEAKVIDLIKDKYLCPLRSKVGASQPELKEVKRNSGGDYVLKSLAKVTNRRKIVSDAIAEAVRIIQAEKRFAVIFFCTDVKHCEMVSNELQKHGIIAPFVTAKTKQPVRDLIAKDFKAGKLRAICNVNVYTEGFNAERVDCIVLLRPTLSAGLFSQMVGRGLRTHSSIRDCLVLDFAGCIDEHGPVDLLGGERTVMAVCCECRESFSRAVQSCPACGWEIPKREIERLERKETERRLHGKKASEKSILSTTPRTLKVDTVFVNRHIKKRPPNSLQAGSPDSLRIQYRCGLSMFREWVCLDHPGYAGQKAREWWFKRFPGNRPRPGKAGMKRPLTVNAALENLFLTQEILEWTKTITVVRKGKFHEIINYNQPLAETIT